MTNKLKRVAEIVTDAAIRADWEGFCFHRDRFEIEVIFGNCFIKDADEKLDYDFYVNYLCQNNGFRIVFYSREDGETKEMTEAEWLVEVDRKFSEICGIHLKTAEEKTT